MIEPNPPYLIEIFKKHKAIPSQLVTCLITWVILAFEVWDELVRRKNDSEYARYKVLSKGNSATGSILHGTLAFNHSSNSLSNCSNNLVNFVPTFLSEVSSTDVVGLCCLNRRPTLFQACSMRLGSYRQWKNCDFSKKSSTTLGRALSCWSFWTPIGRYFPSRKFVRTKKWYL